jgi:transketolase
MLEKGGRGHVGSAFSLVEILRVLYDEVLRYDAKTPRSPQRDRFILSKGHGCLALYVLLAEKGFFPEAELWKFCKPDGILGGHPEYGKVPGVEASTGSLGHGLPIGVGFALNARYEKADHRTIVLASDGESNEGSLWEAALSAGKHKLSNLTVLVDYNKQQSFGTTYEVLDMEPFADKWRAFGFAVEEVDGHDVGQLRAALKRIPFDTQKPGAILCHTIKGKGVSFVENNLNWHHKNKVTEEEVKSLLAELEDKA